MLHWKLDFLLCILVHCALPGWEKRGSISIFDTMTGNCPCATLGLPTYCHHAIEEPCLGLGGRLQPLHGPLVHHGRDVRVLDVEQPKARHVHPAVPVGLQVQGKQVLRHKHEQNRWERKTGGFAPVPTLAALKGCSL